MTDSYIRELDGARMIRIGDGQYVSEEAGRTLGLASSGTASEEGSGRPRQGKPQKGTRRTTG